MTWRAVSCLLVLGAVGCGSGEEPSAPTPQRFEVVSEVLESPEHGPELCLGSVQLSLPPQCSGVPVAGWEWDAVEGVESLNGTTWSERHLLIGTYDGTTFTLTEPPGPPRPFGAPELLRDACSEPRADEPLATFERVEKSALMAAMGRAQSSADFAGLWVTGRNTSVEPGVRLDGLVLNVAFTGELARHRGELREVWGGLLCVEQHEHTQAELRAVQDELPAVARELGLEPQSSSADEVNDVVRLTVVAATAEQQAALDERFGTGTVALDAALRPLD